MKNPIYYDVKDADYFGFRLVWESGPFFLNFDLTSSQGDRTLHRFPGSSTTFPATINVDGADVITINQSVSGLAMESEVGFRSANWRIGVRLMDASGDSPSDPSNKQGLFRGRDGFFEITPGSYRGTRLYFNGSDNTVEQGFGLGHSVNNIELIGFFIDFKDT